MNLPSYFQEFLAEIEPSPSYKQDQRDGHALLRKRLAQDEDFSRYHVSTFLQGSYKRQTAIHPGKDVDIVVVTSLDPSPGKTKPADANALEAEADRIRSRVEEALGLAPVEVDDLIRQIGAPAAVILTVLLELELAGRLARDAGNRVGWV